MSMAPQHRMGRLYKLSLLCSITLFIMSVLTDCTDYSLDNSVMASINSLWRQHYSYCRRVTNLFQSPVNHNQHPHGPSDKTLNDPILPGFPTPSDDYIQPLRQQTVRHPSVKGGPDHVWTFLSFSDPQTLRPWDPGAWDPELLASEGDVLTAVSAVSRYLEWTHHAETTWHALTSPIPPPKSLTGKIANSSFRLRPMGMNDLAVIGQTPPLPPSVRRRYWSRSRYCVHGNAWPGNDLAKLKGIVLDEKSSNDIFAPSWFCSCQYLGLSCGEFPIDCPTETRSTCNHGLGLHRTAPLRSSRLLDRQGDPSKTQRERS